MSTGAENQLKLYAGYARIAAQLGFNYEVFPSSLDDPTSPGKSTLTIPAAFSSDPMFSAPLKYNKAVWIVYIDGNLVEPGQFLVGPYGTYFIADKQPFQPMQAVRTNNTASFGRGEYSETGPIASSVVQYATGIPVFMQFTRKDIQKPAATYGAQLGRAITHWDAFIPLPKDTLKQDDVMTDDAGIKYIVDAPAYTNMGYVVNLRLATV